ncbi:Hsp42p [Sugiyamaella lignohabitans]|uniref:Hsp42p n=1 Tax=Sugiyamaella lignohabitans TaxID=796027 RepID=A0A167FBS2_9ASCO|nr:Hsp42p [Sugiyamaella lignohabitans]ANB15083.1 Hsp42p [Sugiyamaella lignohabitans]
MPRHGFAHAHAHAGPGFGPGFTINGAPIFDFVEALANDFQSHPIFGEENKRKKNWTGNSSANGISVSPRCRSWGVRSGPNGTESDSVVSPPVDVYDTPDSYTVVASVAGANASKINVDFDTTEHELIISGVINSAVSEEHREKYLKIGERRVGKFERKVTVPAEPRVDDENIQAKYSNGVLKVILPKIQPTQAEKRRVVVSVVDDEPEESVPEEQEKSNKEEVTNKEEVSIEVSETSRQEGSATASPAEDEDSVIVESPDKEKTA